MWLGPRRGYAIDWVTQRWVRATGRRVRLQEHPWLDAPVGATREVGGESAWLRRYEDSQHVIYAGVYSVFRPDGQPPMVRVAFPLPNGNCIVLLRPENGEDGALKLVSKGRHFGEPGMYLTVVRGN